MRVSNSWLLNLPPIRMNEDRTVKHARIHELNVESGKNMSVEVKQ